MPKDLRVEIKTLGEVMRTHRVSRVFAEWCDGHSMFIRRDHQGKWLRSLGNLDGDWCEDNGRWYASLSTLVEMDRLRPHKTKRGVRQRLRQITITMENKDESTNDAARV